MTRRERIAVSLLRPINPALILILGVYTVVWGLWLISPFWTVFTQAPLYCTMAGLAPEWVWGSIAVFFGLITTRGALKPSYQNLHWGAWAAFVQWFSISIMYLMADFHNTGGITALCFAFYAAMVWVNTKVNRHIYEPKDE